MGNEVLFGAKAIQEELGISRHRYYRLVELGLPITKDSAGIRIHTKDLYDFFKKGAT